MNEINYLDQPFEELSREQIKQAIKLKFGSLARFAKLCKMEVYEFNNLIRAKENAETNNSVKALFVKAKKMSDSIIEGELSEEIILKLTEALYKEYKYIIEFSDKNKKFSNVWISKVFHGDIKKITPKVRSFAKKLNVELYDKRI